MQTNFAFLAVVPKPKAAPDALVARINADAQAVAVSLQSSGLKQAYVAAQLGIDLASVRGTGPGGRVVL